MNIKIKGSKPKLPSYNQCFDAQSMIDSDPLDTFDSDKTNKKWVPNETRETNKKIK